MNKKLKDIFFLLDMDENNGLAMTSNIKKMTNYQNQFYMQVKEKIGIDAVYFLRDAEGIAKIPTIYFSYLEQYNTQIIAELHRLAWNMGEAPLLFIVTPDQLLIYNNYELPTKSEGVLDPEAGLIDTIKLVADLEAQRVELKQYSRTMLESGEYWRRSKVRFDSRTRVENTLMFNLKVMRKTLIAKIRDRLPEDTNVNYVAIVHGLLSRSILIKYLEERKDSLGQSVFPLDFYSQFCVGASSYTDVLCNKEATYSLFECLQNKFNGDMLPLVQDEFDVIQSEDLLDLRDFLLGDSDLETKQLTLWPLYSFDVIPIQLISSIYELFFHLRENDNEKGTYYTPLHLVDMLLDEVYPWEGSYSPIKVLDPSCGSGIFLVEVYRRMVCRWMRSNDVDSITNTQLTSLLKQSIYGVDLNEEAVRVASFSLSLAMCDFLDPRNIWEELSFPTMINENLFVSDFFEEEKDYNRIQFNLIIGNPPWQSKLTNPALHYLEKNEKVVGDKQIAQAFSLKCADICMPSGNICLLMPSKGFLFNRSSKSVKYRKDFFKNKSVSVIINFSAYRKFLFNHASGPAVAIIYSPQMPEYEMPVFYCTPKPLYTLEDLRKFSVEPNDICRIPLDIVRDDRIWKIAMWGGPRDLELISKLQSSFSSLGDFVKKNKMCSAEGFKRGNRSKQCEDFLGYPIVTAKYFRPFYQDLGELEQVDFIDFECIVSKKRDIFSAPHLLIKQSHKNSRFLASVLDYDAVFNHSILGIHGDVSKLKYLCLIINSKVFTYYHLMTNRRWLVERDELEAGDIWETPIPIPTSQQLEEASTLFGSLKKDNTQMDALEKFVSLLYGLQDYEISLINDAINYTYDYYHIHGKSKSFNKPTHNDFVLYLDTFKDILNNTFGKIIVRESHYFVGDAPLVVLFLKIDGEIKNDPIFHTDSEEVIAELERLDCMLTEERQNLFVRRCVRIYNSNSIYIIKPMQLKYWNYSAASRDADDIFSDIIKTWRYDSE